MYSIEEALQKETGNALWLYYQVIILVLKQLSEMKKIVLTSNTVSIHHLKGHGFHGILRSKKE